MDVVKLPRISWETSVQSALREMKQSSRGAVVIGEGKQAALFTASNLISGLRTVGETTMDQVPGAVSLPIVTGVSPDASTWTIEITQTLRRLFTAPDISYGLIWDDLVEPFAFVVTENGILAGHLNETIYNCSGDPTHYWSAENYPGPTCPHDHTAVTS